MAEKPGDPEQRAERIRVAVESVKREVRGLPLDLAEEKLVAALRRHDAFLPMGMVRGLARQMSDPWWSFRHPLQAIRTARREAREPDPESVALEAETDELSKRLEQSDIAQAVLSMSVHSTRTFDGMVHVVTIDPWSPQIADRIRELAAPIPVTVSRSPEH